MSNSCFVIGVIYGLIGYILVMYFIKIFLKVKKIKGIVIRMGVLWYCKMFCLNEFVDVKKVKKSKWKE